MWHPLKGTSNSRWDAPQGEAFEKIKEPLNNQVRFEMILTQQELWLQVDASKYRLCAALRMESELCAIVFGSHQFICGRHRSGRDHEPLEPVMKAPLQVEPLHTRKDEASATEAQSHHHPRSQSRHSRCRYSFQEVPASAQVWPCCCSLHWPTPGWMTWGRKSAHLIYLLSGTLVMCCLIPNLLQQMLVSDQL